MSDCLFCKVARGEIPSDTVYEDERVIAFRDIAPQAPVHVLIVPRRHIADLDAVTDDDGTLIAGIASASRKIAADLGISGAYRLVSNCGPSAGDTANHRVAVGGKEEVDA